MSQPTDAPSVSTSDADSHGRKMKEIIPADREYPSPQSQLTELVGRSLYEEYIVRSHEECTKCVVLIRCYQKDDPANKPTNLQTGIIVASGKSSCCIITSPLYQNEDQVCEVQFCDGTKSSVEKPRSGKPRIGVRENFGMSIVHIKNDNMAKAGQVKFADSAIDSCEKVFTCGYNSTLNKTSFFSGSIVSGVGMKDKSVEDATLFVHGCSTGNNGHLGSAVFNERKNLVGMNILYTMSSGENYRLPEQREGGSRADIGGIVSALDLTSIGLGWASLVGKKGKTIHEIQQELTSLLMSRKDKQKVDEPTGGTSVEASTIGS